MIKIVPSALSPIVKDGDVDIQNIVAVILRNAGTATVSLWNGLYTLDSKETLSLNVTENNGMIDLFNVPVSFNTSTGSIKRLEVVVLKISNKDC